ncbi:MAG: hypothetical protein Q9201_001925 [Fulgogasparrea decipioides]
MASRLAWLQALKLKQLETIARATGVNSSGSKPTLISVIENSLLQSQAPGTFTNNVYSTQKKKKTNDHGREDGYNIISIDPGIRNLAYCHLSLPPSFPNTPSVSPFPHIRSPPTTPVIKSWSRLNIATTVTSSQDLHPSLNHKSQNLSEETLAKISESFSPSLYASHAYRLLVNTLLPLNPTHILIERQRFRSMGGNAVQEWTLRVNMFEAMLYSTLHTLSRQGIWKGEVIPIIPNKVSRYWLPGDAKAERSEKKTKSRKMEIVRDMVSNNWGVEIEGGGGGVVEERASRTREFLTKNGKARMGGKFDDLSDCLLQGLAWCRWEENKWKVWEKGEGVLEELMMMNERGEKGIEEEVDDR